MTIFLTIPGVPPQKNSRDRVDCRKGKDGKCFPSRYPTKEFKRFVDVVALVWDRERARHGLQMIDAGPLEITLRAFWDRERHLDFDTGMGDVDAPVSCVLDALQKVGVIDDDVRIVRLEATKHYDKANPRVEVELREAPAEGQLGLLPSTPPPPKRWEDRDDW